MNSDAGSSTARYENARSELRWLHSFSFLVICWLALDRLNRYEATLWRQAGQILFALDALDRRKPQERGRRFHAGNRQDRPADGRGDY
jgi:hypothetical protein